MKFEQVLIEINEIDYMMTVNDNDLINYNRDD